MLEVGPGLGSLTLAILETGATMTAVEIDPPVAQRLPHTIDTYMPDARNRLTVINKDALALTSADLPEFSGDEPFTLVANLPYNVATPIILTLLERFDMLTSFVVMVQKEVADRLTATPGSKIYGAPSVKLAWYGSAERVGNIGRHVFWASAERGFGPGRVHPCPVARPARPPVAPADVPVGPTRPSASVAKRCMPHSSAWCPMKCSTRRASTDTPRRDADHRRIRRSGDGAEAIAA